MERCPNCGGRLNKIDVLCPRCGTVVEVIQIKSSISSASEAAADQKPNAATDAQKKEFPENFIVYNEDFPSEEAGSKSMPAADEPAGTAVMEPLADGALTEVSALTSGSDEAAAPELQELQENSIEKYVQDNELSDNEEDNDYSARYLEHLKNINLPEIEDIQSFDPEEFLRQYRRSNELEQETDEIPEEVPQKKLWLEIEEAYETDDVSVSEGEAPQSPAAADDTRSSSGRRYRREERKGQRETKSAVPERRSKPKKYNVALTVLLWLVISAAFFCCFMFFDNYVQKAYGSYDSFIYTITDGKIDLDPMG